MRCRDTAAKSTFKIELKYAIPGVGSTPTSITSTPPDAIPAASAALKKSPEMRVSRPMIARRRVWFWDDDPRMRAAASPSFKASCGVNSLLATPRTPSVPKSRGISFLLH